MSDRSRPLSSCLIAMVALAAPLSGQSVRQVALNVATGQIDRGYLPSDEAFDFLIRASSELREFRGSYQVKGAGSGVDLATWTRKDPSQSKDATLRVAKLRAGTTYLFRFTFVRRANGNEGRLVEARTQDILRDGFRAAPDQPLDAIAAAAAPRLAAALDSLIPGAVATPTSPYSRRPDPIVSALAIRGVDLVHAEYRRELTVVADLGREFRGSLRRLMEAPILRRAIDDISRAIAARGGYAELAAPLDACRATAAGIGFERPLPIVAESDQLALLLALKTFDANAGACLGILRDVRLPRYQDLRVTGTAAVSDLFPPIASRLEALRGETERLVALGRKRDGALGQVAGDLRRGLDAGVTLTTRVDATLETASILHPSSVSLGIGLVGAHVPCSATGSCLRIAPDVTMGVRLSRQLTAEIGLTIASLERDGRTRDLFWFSNALAGLSMRLGDRPHRVGAGAIVLRRDEPGKNGGFRLGWYAGVTLFDFRI